MAERDPAETWAELRARLAAAVEPELRRMVAALDRLLARWPWLYRRLGGEPRDDDGRP